MNNELFVVNCLNKECGHEFKTNTLEFTKCPSCDGNVEYVNDYDDVFTVDKDFSKDAEFTISKNSNMHYWDEIEGIVENSFKEIAKFVVVSVEEINDYDDIKSITGMYVSSIEKRFNVKFPIVND